MVYITWIEEKLDIIKQIKQIKPNIIKPNEVPKKQI